MQYYERDDFLSITIAAKRRWLVIIPMFIFVLFWSMVGLVYIGVLIGIFPGFANISIEVYMFIVWFYTECHILFIICWGFWGEEIIEVSNGVLYIKKKLFFYTLSNDYLLSEILNIKPKEEYEPLLDITFLGMGSTSIVFNYKDKKINFGLYLSKEEATAVVEQIKSYGYIKTTDSGRHEFFYR